MEGPTMRLSPHFLMAEMTASSTADRLGLRNDPPPELVPRLIRTAEMLERVRTTLGAPVIVTSGYRCEAVNRAVGGVTSSDHTQGHAADIRAPGYGPPLAVAQALAPLVSVLGIGQLIYETVGRSAWVHVSTRTPDQPANRVLTYDGRRYVSGIRGVA
jgi:zinc D-Ala-D-Ala carboxypeptidase